MKQYIKNLTNQIIGEHNLGELYDQIHFVMPEEYAKRSFIQEAYARIRCVNVNVMSHETLGSAFCSLEKDDYCEKDKVFEIEGGSEKPADIVRKNLSVLLARAVYFRFRAGEGKYLHTEAYFSPKAMQKIERSGVKKLVDDLVVRRDARN